MEDLKKENEALRAIIFGLYNGGQVPAEHVALYQQIGEGATPPSRTVGFTAETSL